MQGSTKVWTLLKVDDYFLPSPDLILASHSWLRSSNMNAKEVGLAAFRKLHELTVKEAKKRQDRIRSIKVLRKLNGWKDYENKNS